MMDISKLVEGQKVYMGTLHFANEGKVVKITPEDVEVLDYQNQLLRFDTNGKQCGGQYILENGPWELIDYIPVCFRSDSERAFLGEQCANCGYIRALHDPKEEYYEWRRREKGLCDHFEAKKKQDGAA